MTHVIQWNGVDLPLELRDLPPGLYVLERVDEGLASGTKSNQIQADHALESLHAKLGRPIPASDFVDGETVTRTIED